MQELPKKDSELIIFGCDGVLVDSEPVLARARQKFLAAAGLALSVEEIAERFAGMPFMAILLTLEAEGDRPLQASMIEQVEALVGERLRREARPTPGAAEIIAALPRRAIASNASRQRLDLMLEASRLASLFAGSAFSTEDVAGGKPKPAPDLLLHAASRMNTDPAECFVVEDTAQGIMAAIAAGMRPIGYTGASHSFPGHADLLTEAGAETVINRWVLLPQILAALRQWRED